MIRKSGLIIFSAFAITGIAFWFLMLNPMVKCLIETKGSELNEARIDVGSVKFSFIPAGVTIKGLQVTDKENPMRNLFTAGIINVKLDGGALFKKKIVINDLAAEDVMLNTERKKSGAIKKYKTKKEVGAEKTRTSEELKTPEFTMPNAKDVLSDIELKSVTLAKALQGDIEKSKAKWEKRLKELPNEKTFKKHKADYEELKSSSKGGGFGGILKSLSGGGKLAKDIKSDIKEINKAKKDFNKELASFKARAKEINIAKKEDVKLIADKYGSPEGLAKNISKALFGPKVEGYVGKALSLYKRYKPKSTGVKGKPVEEVKSRKKIFSQNILFKETNPSPNFLLKNALVSITMAGEEGSKTALKGTLKNISSEPSLLKEPALLEFKGNKFSSVEKVNVDAILDHRKSDTYSDKGDFDIRSLAFNNAVVSETDKLKLTLLKGYGNFKGNINISDGKIKSTVDIKLSDTKFSKLETGKDSEMMTALNSALMGASSMTFNIKIDGDITHPSVRVKSSADKLIKNAMASVVKGKADQFKKDLNSELTSKLSGPKEKIKSSLGGLTSSIDSPLKDRQKLGKGIL